jgi:hypothetical protein
MVRERRKRPATCEKPGQNGLMALCGDRDEGLIRLLACVWRYPNRLLSSDSVQRLPEVWVMLNLAKR